MITAKFREAIDEALAMDDDDGFKALQLAARAIDEALAGLNTKAHDIAKLRREFVKENREAFNAFREANKK
jgi:hypothetical protein